MDVVQVFNDELQSLNDAKPPVSKAKMGLITRAAMKGVKFYKHIVQNVEKFIARCRPEYKVPGLYVVDSIVRQSRHQFGLERDVYAARFSRNLPITFSNLFSGCLPDDKPKIVRVLNLWQKNAVFASHIISPLLDLANPNATNHLSESILSSDSPDIVDQLKQGQASKFNSHHYARTNSTSQQHSKGSSTKSHRESGLRFSKNMLDFDYDEDDDDDGDETPTEAEPPLSSTLNKIEMEQRSRNNNDTPSNQNQSSQQNHQQQQQHHHHHSSSSSSNRRSEPDPLFERFNRLVKNQSIMSDSSNDLSASEIRSSRARSRSPPPQAPIVREKQPSPRINTQTNRSNIVVTSDTSSEVAVAEKESERRAERLRKCLPDIKDKHLTVCSSTLWLGHVPKTVSEADISDAFGEYGTITSINLIPPRGCAYVCMDRRQDAKRALSESKDLKLNGSHIKMAWAPGKGFKEYKKLKDFWEVSTGASYIPYAKIDSSIDFDVLEEGGVIDEDSMSMEMRERREKKTKEKEEKLNGPAPVPTPVQPAVSLPIPSLPNLSQPPPFSMPPPNLSIPPPTALSQASALGGIPFPPPIVTSSSNNHLGAQQTMGAPLPQAPHTYDNGDSQDCDNVDSGELSPSKISLDQQLSMTERQISMVEQQLSLMQQAAQAQSGLGSSQHQQQQSHLHQQQQVLFQQGPNPMIFDIPPHMLATGHHLLDPTNHIQQMPMFANSPQQQQQHLLSQPPPMLPMNPAGLNPNMNGNSMANFRY